MAIPPSVSSDEKRGSAAAAEMGRILLLLPLREPFAP